MECFFQLSLQIQLIIVVYVAFSDDPVAFGIVREIDDTVGDDTGNGNTDIIQFVIKGP
mgnify:CR=1 FL=1